MKFKEIMHYINESLFANKNKLFKMLQNRLGSEPLTKYLVTYDSLCETDIIVYIRTSILKFISEVELKRICNTAGYYCSIHYDKNGKPLKYDPMYITPINQRDKKEMPTDNVYWHVSMAKNLDKTGIRLRSRKVDNEFDIYDDRIYLLPATTDGELKQIIDDIASEHDTVPENIVAYEITLPVGYEIYQDPTKIAAVYVTNAIPAKYVTKLDR